MKTKMKKSLKLLDSGEPETWGEALFAGFLMAIVVLALFFVLALVTEADSPSNTAGQSSHLQD